jgi:hypothetical protein
MSPNHLERHVLIKGLGCTMVVNRYSGRISVSRIRGPGEVTPPRTFEAGEVETRISDDEMLRRAEAQVLSSSALASLIMKDALGMFDDEPGESLPTDKARNLARALQKLGLEPSRANLPRVPAAFEPEDGEDEEGWSSAEVNQALLALDARDNLIHDMVRALLRDGS